MIYTAKNRFPDCHPLLMSFYEQKSLHWDFSGGPMVKTLRSQCKGHRFNPWSGNKEPTSCTVRKEGRKERKRKRERKRRERQRREGGREGGKI